MGGKALCILLMSYGRFRIPLGADSLVGHEEVPFEQNIIANRVISTIFPRICLAPKSFLHILTITSVLELVSEIAKIWRVAKYALMSFRDLTSIINIATFI